jgi:hypothetical protein
MAKIILFDEGQVVVLVEAGGEGLGILVDQSGVAVKPCTDVKPSQLIVHTICPKCQSASITVFFFWKNVFTAEQYSDSRVACDHALGVFTPAPWTDDLLEEKEALLLFIKESAADESQEA